MGKTIKIGGVGKNPAIEKLNQLNKINSRLDAASRLEMAIFSAENQAAQEVLMRRRQIIKDFSINFADTD